MAQAGGDAISVDWRLPIDEAWDIIGDDRAIQGNLDPVVLLAGRDVALAKARDILDRVGGRPGPHLQLRPRPAARHRPGSGARGRRLRPRVHSAHAQESSA